MKLRLLLTKVFEARGTYGAMIGGAVIKGVMAGGSMTVKETPLASGGRSIVARFNSRVVPRAIMMTYSSMRASCGSSSSVSGTEMSLAKLSPQISVFGSETSLIEISPLSQK